MFVGDPTTASASLAGTATVLFTATVRTVVCGTLPLLRTSALAYVTQLLCIVLPIWARLKLVDSPAN